MYFNLTLFIVIATIITSYRGFKDQFFLDRFSFRIDALQVQKDYKRLITSGFLHVNWTHLIMNMIALFFFAGAFENQVGSLLFLLIYFTSIVGGNLLSLFIHRFDSGYSAVGASGAVMGIIFAAIALSPGMSISLFFLPAIPGWLFGLLYVIIAIYGIRSRTNNVGHDTHLGGGLAGMLTGILFYPSILLANTFTIVIIALPAIAFILFLVYKPEALFVDDLFKKNRHLTIEDKYNLSKKNQQLELDRILEKIHKKGMNSLSQKEKDMLKEYSK